MLESGNSNVLLGCFIFDELVIHTPDAIYNSRAKNHTFYFIGCGKMSHLEIKAHVTRGPGDVGAGSGLGSELPSSAPSLGLPVRLARSLALLRLGRERRILQPGVGVQAGAALGAARPCIFCGVEVLRPVVTAWTVHVGSFVVIFQNQAVRRLLVLFNRVDLMMARTA